VGQAQEKAEEVTTQATGKLREQLDQRSTQAGDQIVQQATDLRAVGQSLREQGKEGPANAAEKVAEYAEKAGGYLREKDSDSLLSDVEDFGRRQPWAVGAGALAIGFAASRFLKASSTRRYAGRYGTQRRTSEPALGEVALAPPPPAMSPSSPSVSPLAPEPVATAGSPLGGSARPIPRP
jgi:hypothetical protein